MSGRGRDEIISPPAADDPWRGTPIPEPMAGLDGRPTAPLTDEEADRLRRETLFLKWTLPLGQGAYITTTRWPLPPADGGPGRWTPRRAGVGAWGIGWHVTAAPNALFHEGSRLFLAEIDGRTYDHGREAGIAAERARLVRELPLPGPRWWRSFACDCAARALVCLPADTPDAARWPAGAGRRPVAPRGADPAAVRRFGELRMLQCWGLSWADWTAARHLSVTALVWREAGRADNAQLMAALAAAIASGRFGGQGPVARQRDRARRAWHSPLCWGECQDGEIRWQTGCLFDALFGRATTEALLGVAAATAACPRSA